MHRAVPPLQVSLTRRVVLAVVVLSTAGYCAACPPETIPPPDLTGVYILPPEAWVAPSDKFTLRARLYDSDGNVRPDVDAASLLWTVDPSPGANLTISGPNQGVKVQVIAPGPGSYPPLSITARLPSGGSVRVPVYVTSGAGPAVVDWSVANFVDFAPPNVALVDGMTSVSVNDTLVAFTKKGPLDYLGCPPTSPSCGEVSLFSAVQALGRVASIVLRGDRCEEVDFTGLTTPTPCARTTGPSSSILRKIPVAEIFVLASGEVAPTSSADWSFAPTPPSSDMIGTVKADVLWAEKILTEGWTGLSLAPLITDLRSDDLVQIVLSSNTPEWCTGGSPSVRQQLQDNGIAAAKILGGPNITVAYIDKLLMYDGSEITWAHGMTCPWNAADGTIVLVSWSQWQPSTLIHEVLHAVGPWQTAPWGHSTYLEGFEASNIMWTWELDNKPAPRSTITLGQAFRLSLDSRSIFYRGMTYPQSNTWECQFFPTTEQPDSPCPRMARDVIRR